MKTQFRIYWSAWLLLIGLAGCAVTDIDRTVNFDNLRTYSWGKSEISAVNPMHRGEMVDKKIKYAVEQEFSRMGIVRSDSHPDFLVSYKTFTEEKQNSFGRTYPGPMYPGYFYGPFFYGPFIPYAYAFYPYGYGMMPYSYSGTYTVTEGTLVIDITDTATKEVVWRGTVKGNISESTNLEKILSKGVKAILKKYPTMQRGTDNQKPPIA